MCLSSKINCWPLSTDNTQHVTGLEIKANLILRNWQAEQYRQSSRETWCPFSYPLTWSDRTLRAQKKSGLQEITHVQQATEFRKKEEQLNLTVEASDLLNRKVNENAFLRRSHHTLTGNSNLSFWQLSSPAISHMLLPFFIDAGVFSQLYQGALLLCFFYRKLTPEVHKALLCQGMAFKLQWAGRETLNPFPKPAYSRRKETLRICAVWKRWTWKELKCKRHATSLALNWKTSSLWTKCFQNDACPCKIRETSSKEYLWAYKHFTLCRELLVLHSLLEMQHDNLIVATVSRS